MEIHKIRSLHQYQHLVEKYADDLLALRAKEVELTERFKQSGAFHCDGYSWPIQADSQFLLDDLYWDKHLLNFRERLVCKQTHLNNRIRAAIHLFEGLYKPQADDAIYITEQLTPLYRWLSEKYSKITGSEYLANMNWLQKFKSRIKVLPLKLHHQDLTQLSFPSQNFKHILSYDCLEHIPDYKLAFKEIHRVLVPGGRFMFSVPFDLNNAKNLIRASIADDGSIKHYAEPDYHGDPVSIQGILSFYTFGWEVLDDLLDVGFKDAYGAVYWSTEMAYLGGTQLMLCAEK